MNINENVRHDGAGVVTGCDTERVVAEFSHEAEADGFCELYNSQEGTQRVSDEAITHLFNNYPEAYSAFYEKL